jgi:hypothetical protein
MDLSDKFFFYYEILNFNIGIYGFICCDMLLRSLFHWTELCVVMECLIRLVICHYEFSLSV